MTNAELRDRIGLTAGLPDYHGPEGERILYPLMNSSSEKQYIRMVTKGHRRDFWIWFSVAIIAACAFVVSVWEAMAYIVK